MIEFLMKVWVTSKMTISDFMKELGVSGWDAAVARNILKKSPYSKGINTRKDTIDGNIDEIMEYVKARLSEELGREENNEPQLAKEDTELYNLNILSDNSKRLAEGNPNALYDLKGCRGRSMKVFPDRCVIIVDSTVGAILTGNATDGEKTIFYHDVVGIQFKYPGVVLGYLQLETASAIMNNGKNNLFNENTFTYEDVNMNSLMDEVKRYIIDKVALYKRGPFSVADEIMKYHNLLNNSVITQEEFDRKKEELLSLPY